MKDILKFALKCLLAPILLVFGMGVAGKILGWGSEDSGSSE